MEGPIQMTKKHEINMLYHLGDQIKKTEMSRAYSKNGGVEVRGNVRKGDNLEDPSVDGRIILKWVLEKWDGGTDRIDLAQDRNRWWALANAVMDFRFRKVRGIS
jgi:hypothetical protein